MNPMHSPEDIFRNFLYDYLNKSGLSNTAQSLRNEARINGQTPPEFNLYPHGFLYDLWMRFYHMYISRQDMPRSSGQSQPARMLFSFRHNGIVKSLDFHPTEEFLCSSDTQDGIQVWSLSHYITIKNCKAGVSLVRFQPVSGMLLAVANQNVIDIFDFKTFIVLKRLQGHVKYIPSLCWDVTGKMIASVSEDGVRVWTLSMDGQCLYEYPSKGKMFMSVIFHP